MSARSRRIFLGLVMLAVLAVASAAWGATSRSAARADSVRVPVQCAAEWDLEQRWTQLDLRAPDTPSYLGNPSGFNPFVTLAGTAVFTSGGRFVVTCAGSAAIPLGGAPWRAAGFRCRIYRGGTDYSLLGAKLYTGRGHVQVTTNGFAVIGCAGSFNRIVSSPAD